MSVEITEAFVDQFATNVHVLAQQKDSRFEACVDIDHDIIGASKSVERIGAGEAQDRTARHEDTKYVDTPHSKRWLDLADKVYADLIDEQDKVRMLIDPTSPYVQAAVMALNRKKDDVIIAAMTGSARTKSSGDVALPSAQKIAVGGTGLTLAKLISARELLDEAEVEEDEQRYFATSAKQLSDLLALTQVTSSDYASVKALVQGDIDTFMGFKFIRSERLNKTGNDRYCPAWAKTGMKLGIGIEKRVRVTELPTKNYSVQVYADMSLGAVRTEEVRVVEVACQE